MPGLFREVDRLFRAGGGRIRLGWRLVLWALLVAAGMAVLGAVLPAGISEFSGSLLGAGLAAGWALLALDGRPPAALGFHADRSAVGEAALGLGLGAAVALLAVGLVALAGGVRWIPEAGSVAGWLGGAVTALWIFALPAAAEEVVFRGYPFQAVAESWGPAAALAVTSVGFGAVHLANPGASWTGALNVAAAGAFLGLVLLRTGSLWWATSVHLGWNWAHGYAADLRVSGLDLVDAPLVVARTGGPEWVSGGAFGPEGSVLSTVALAGAAVWVWRTARLEPSSAVLEAGPLALLRAPRGDGGESARRDGPGAGARREEIGDHGTEGQSGGDG